MNTQILLLAQISPQAMSFFKLAFLIALLMVCLLIGAAIFKKMQKRWREEDMIGRGAGLFDMDDLRSLRDEGKLSEEEYERAMQITADKKKAAMNAILAEERAKRIKQLEKQGLKPEEIETVLKETSEETPNTSIEQVATENKSDLDQTKVQEKSPDVVSEKSQRSLMGDDELGEELLK